MVFYRLLLLLLPADFRREYGQELVDTVADQWRASSSLGAVARLQFWPRQWFALLRVSVGLRREGDFEGLPQHDGRRRPAAFDGVWRDIRYSTRSLARRPGFTVVAVVTLGIGVGATTAMFSAVNSVLLRALPYEDAANVVVLRQVDSRVGALAQGASAANVRDVAATSRTLSYASVAEAHGLRLIEEGRAVSIRGWLVSEGFFEAIGGRVHLGRSFLPHEFIDGNERVVLLSHASWQTRFGGDPDILGQDLILDGSAHTVVGVLPSTFKFPSASEIWGPRPARPWDADQRGQPQLDAVARLAPGATALHVQTELDQIAADLADVYPETNRDWGLRAIPLRRHLLGDVQSPLLLLFGAVGLVLCIAAANVAGLQLARGSGRSREYSVRGALGASSWRVLRLVIVESLILAGAGGVLGVGIAFVGVDLIQVFGPDHLTRIDELRIDPTVLGFALVAALASAVLSGVTPAVRASKMDLNAALTDGSRGSTGGRQRTSLRDRLVVGQIAVALVLTIGAGLLVRSFDRLLDNELGFDPEGRLALQVWAYSDDHQPALEYFQRSVTEILAVPGVENVGLTTNLPLADDRSILARGSAVPFSIDGQADPLGERAIDWAAIDGAYGDAMGIAVTAGRTFGTQDHAASPPVLMVNEAFVRRHFPDRTPLGQHVSLQLRTRLSRQIVGVLADVRRQGLESEPRPEAYVPLSQHPSNGLTFVVRAAGDPAELIGPVKDAMWSVDPTQATWATREMQDLLGDWSRQRRFNTGVLAAFAALALFLAGIGVYGLMSFSVEQRIGELGIRRALGSDARGVRALILKRGLKLALAGVGLGLVGSLILTRLLQGMLFDIDAFDPLTFAVLSAFVVAIALLAAFIPAHRASRIDPIEALRAG